MIPLFGVANAQREDQVFRERLWSVGIVCSMTFEHEASFI